MSKSMSRRTAVKAIASTTAAAALLPSVANAEAPTAEAPTAEAPTAEATLADDVASAARVRAGRLKQSVSRWPYNRIPLADFCKAVAAMGLTAIDLLERHLRLGLELLGRSGYEPATSELGAPGLAVPVLAAA